MKINKFINRFLIFLIAFCGLAFASCKKYVDAGPSATGLTADKIYNDSLSTLSAVMALYSYNNINAAWILNHNQYGSMAADEAYYFNNATFDPYRTNTLSAGNLGNVVSNNSFLGIGIANINIENITASTSLSSSFKSQLLGECLFWRAYFYFNLVNYFGDIPLVLSSNISETALLPRSPKANVYDQILKDLLDAQSKVSTAYPSIERARINKAAVSALLARVYLYMQKWPEAEAESTSLISSGGTYTLETNLNNVFLKTSNEVIWQVVSNVSSTITGVTRMGTAWIPSGTVPVFVLYDTLAKTFETGDQRKVNWTKSLVYNGLTYYYPFKYKIRVNTAVGNEYNVMFRLAEQYLIRAEARAQQSNFSGAQSDVNAIRNRAGLASLTLTDKNSVMTALEKERWVELFTEMSDRWFNLKRTGRIDAVIKATKPGWQSYQALYPIPLADRTANPALTDNPGY